MATEAFVLNENTFTDHQHPTFSGMVLEYMDGLTEQGCFDLLVRLGLEPDHARHYLAWLQGEDVTIHWPEDKTVEPSEVLEPTVHKIFHSTAINLFRRK